MRHPATTRGMGDESTWPGCAGHPMDPRTPEEPNEIQDARDVCDEIRSSIRTAERGLTRGDIRQFKAAMEAAKRYLADMDFSEGAA